MKKLLLVLLVLGSTSIFAQHNPSFKMPAPLSVSNGWVVKIAVNYQVEGIEDRGDTVLVKGPYFQTGNVKYGILKRDRKTLCEDMGLGQMVSSSIVMARKDLNVIKQQMFVPGPNRVIDEIECAKKD